MLRDNTGRFVDQGNEYWTPDRWDEGVYSEVTRYFYVYRPDCPNALNGGYVKRCVAVWWLETGQITGYNKVLHHIDGDRSNDKFENLEELTTGDHIRRHKLKPLVRLVCNYCKKVFERKRKGLSRGEGKFCCQYCFYAYGSRTPAEIIYADENR